MFQLTRVIARSKILGCNSPIRSSSRSISSSSKIGSGMTLDLIEKMTKKLKDVKLRIKLPQKTLFSNHAKIAKPLNDSVVYPRWNPFYFRDLGNGKMQKVFADLEQTIHDSTIHDTQNRYFTVVIQGSGCGKSQLAYQYCLNHRALFMNFLQGAHLGLIDTLQYFVRNLQREYKLPNNKVSSWDQELAFTKIAFQATSLLPLTFIQFADKFLTIGEDSCIEEELNEVFLRMTHNSRYLIAEMFEENLQLYATDSALFEKFKNQMYEAAAKMKLEAMIYDSVMEFKSFPRMFLHHPFEAPLAYKRLKDKRKGLNDALDDTDAPSTLTTSLLYLLRVAIEDLVKTANIPQVLLTHYSEKDLELPLYEVSNRNSLKVRKFVWTESPEERWQRFYSELNTALELDKPENSDVAAKLGTLQPFAIRASYLWPFWNMLSDILTHKSKSLCEVVDSALEEHKSMVLRQVQGYTVNASIYSTKQWWNKFLIYAALGRRYIRGDQNNLSALLETGIIPLPAGYESFMKQMVPSDTIIPLCDPFAMHHLQSSMVANIDKFIARVMTQHDLDRDNELLGEAFALAVLSNHKYQTLDKLGFEKSFLKQFTIAEDIKLHDFLDLSLTTDQNLLSCVPELTHHSHILTPAKSICSDFNVFEGSGKLFTRQRSFAVGLTSENNIQAVLCIQSKLQGYLTFYEIKNALSLLEPSQLYANGPAKLKMAWEEMKSQVKTPHIWIRVILCRDVPCQVRKEIEEFNEKNPFQPVLLWTPHYLPEGAFRRKLQNEYLYRDNYPWSPTADLKMTRFFDSTILSATDQAQWNKKA